MMREGFSVFADAMRLRNFDIFGLVLDGVP
jgi:hypothetical protein